MQVERRAAFRRSDRLPDPNGHLRAQKLPLALRADGATGGKRAMKAAWEGEGHGWSTSEF